jgi:putative SOS response-associated peptidase YedK
MCNYERLRSGPAEVRLMFNVDREFDATGNMGEVDKFPRRSGPIIRQRKDGKRELLMMEWGHPYLKREKGSNELALKENGETYAPTPTTNIRHPHYPMFRDYLTPEFRCLVPSNRFSEPNPKAKHSGQPKNVWFGMKEPKEALYAFAGIWRSWNRAWSDKEAGEGEVYAFLTTEPNELVKPIHGKAMPVILKPEDYDTWLNADWKDAKKLQTPFPADLMAIYDESA